MIKKFLNYQVFIVILLSIIGTILFGALLRHHYLYGDRFQNLQKIAVFFAEIPHNMKFMLRNKTITSDVIEPIYEKIYEDKKFFDKKLNSSRDELILISRHDGDLGKAIVEIRDLNSFEVLHSYFPDIKKIYEKIDMSKHEFEHLKKDLGLNRFHMVHPAITEKGEIIFQSTSPLVKIDFNSKIVWVNDEDLFHHDINLDLDENIYSASHKYPISKKVAKFIGINTNSSNDTFGVFYDDTINILDQKGEVLYSKSVSEIFIENGMYHRIFSQSQFIQDPIHLNDIQPVLKDGPYFKKGDLFLSIRNLSLVILYRPETNKIIKVIEGAIYNQHDVDILDQKTISIYNNNTFSNYHNKRLVRNNNEIVIYDFETDSFSKRFEDTFKLLNINTPTAGLVDFLDDGSAIVEDNNNGRIFYLNNNGEVIWEFYNLNSKKKIYDLWWARVLSPRKSKIIREMIKEKKND